MGQTLTIQLEQEGPATLVATARTHTVVVDRPIGKGGDDRGALGGEYLLIGLGGCFLSNLLAAIRSREAAIAEVRATISGTIDGPPDRFVAFTVAVTAVHRDATLVRKLIDIAARGCAVTNTLRLAAPVTIEFEGAEV